MKRLNRIRLLPFVLLLPVALVLAAGGCSVVEQGAGLLSEAGVVSSKDSQSLVKASETLRRTFSEITDEEEYYIGRSVAALILSRYEVLENTALTRYVNTLGAAVAAYSDRPETFAGYHVLILDTDEVNALAAPGGFIFISKGLMKLCRNEEMLAAVLAHEIGHVHARHGLQSIKKSRLVDAFRLLGQEAADRYAPEKVAQLTKIFEDVLGDIVENLIEKGYDRKYEYEADEWGVRFAVQTGYDPEGLVSFLESMAARTAGSEGGGWFHTHPSTEDRLGRVRKTIGGLGEKPPTEETRTRRFLAAVKGLN